MLYTKNYNEQELHLHITRCKIMNLKTKKKSDLIEMLLQFLICQVNAELLEAEGKQIDI